MPSLPQLERRAAARDTARTAGRLRADLSRYAGRPVQYAREHLGRFLTPKQAGILSLLRKPPYRVLVRSANTQGKTYLAALKCSHFFDTQAPSITLATAPTKDSVCDLLFKELRTMRPSRAGFLPKAARLEYAPDHYVHGFTTNNPDAFQGRHGVALGLFFDEATGIDRAFWERGETMFESTGQHWWLASYNPNDSSSYPALAEELGTWHVVQLNALEHPNIAAELDGRAPPIPGAIRLDTVIRRIAQECESIREGFHDAAVDFNFPLGSPHWWRPTTPAFEAQILGRWPVSPTSALWSPVLFEMCCGQMDVNPHWGLAVGCDVARFGDDKTVLAVRRGPVVVALEVYSGVTTSWIAQRCRDIVHEHLMHLPVEQRMLSARHVPVYIDDTGGYGAGVVDQAHGYKFVGLNMSSASSDPRFPRLRSQLWCQLADAAASGAVNFAQLAFEDRKMLKAELTSARYQLDYQGRRVVEPKSNIKERLGRSPDRADAVILAFSLAAE